jgi:hypothetical protein
MKVDPMPVQVWVNPSSVQSLSFAGEAILRDTVGDRPGEWKIFILDMFPSPECVITVEGPDDFLFRRKFEGLQQQRLEFIVKKIAESLPPYIPPAKCAKRKRVPS